MNLNCSLPQRCARLVAFTTTWLAACVLGAEPTNKVSRPVVFCLRAHPPETGKFEDERGWLWGDLLIRELMRQAVLIAARDELGWATRDEALREPIADHADAHIIDIVTQARHGRNVWLKITREDQELWQHEEPCIVGPVNQYVDITEKMERLSRNELVEILRQAGIRDRSLPTPNQGGAREETLRQLREVNLLSQFDALRRCHAEIRRDGESPQRLGALVRAYANLGQLTQPFLSSAHRSLRARSLLYAQRLISADPESPWGWWHRAYALSLAGLQRWSIEDLKRADELTAQQPGELTSPAWVPLLKDFNRYAFASLRDQAQGESELSQLAGLLLFVSVETSGTTPLIIETGVLVSQRNPSDQRVWDGMHGGAGVSYLHLLTELAPKRLAAALGEQLPGVQSITAAARQIVDHAAGKLDTAEGRSRLGLALVQRAGATTDRHDPSLAVLGRFIEEQNVLQIYRRAIFLRDALGVDSAEYLQENYQAYRGHPYAKLISSLAIRRHSQPEQYQTVLKDQYIGDTNLASMYHLMRRVPQEIQFANLAYRDAWARLYQQRPAIEFEYCMEISAWDDAAARVQQAKWMYDVSPHSAFRHYVLLRDDWEGSQSSLDQWQRDYGQHPLIPLALAEQYESQRNWEQAEAQYRRYIELTPTVEGLISLARIQHQRKSEDWLATLESALELRDYGLSHAKVNTIVAATLMGQGNHRKALPFAEAAAESYSGWALHCLALCYEGLGEFEKAESVVRASSERYEDWDWYLWCIRTGRGDIEAAWNEYQRLLREQTTADSPALRMAEIQHLIVSGQKQKAFTLIKKHGDIFDQSFHALAGAMLAEELGLGDEARARVDAIISSAEQDHAVSLLKPIAAFLGRAMAAEEIGEEDIQRWLGENTVPANGSVLAYLGWHLANRGQVELAKKYLGSFAGSREWTHQDVLYSQVKLRELGVRVEDIAHQYNRAFIAEQ